MKKDIEVIHRKIIKSYREAILFFWFLLLASILSLVVSFIPKICGITAGIMAIGALIGFYIDYYKYKQDFDLS